MPRSKLFRRAMLALPALAFLAVPAGAHSPTGGASAPERPVIGTLACETPDGSACSRGDVLRVTGEHLRHARLVIFLGRRGSRDDQRARAKSATPHRLRVRIPAKARSGRVKIVSAMAGTATTPSRLRLVRRAARPAPVAASPGAADGVFPIRGSYDFGSSTNRFGGGRGHEGQDVFARCGTPVVSALAGEVTFKKWHDRAGHYVVVTAEDGTSQAYMHLRRAASVEKGQPVSAGQRIGDVGDTGRASGCHLHFELWTAPGWYAGGEPVDPLPALRRWAASD